MIRNFKTQKKKGFGFSQFLIIFTLEIEEKIDLDPSNCS